MDNRHIAKSLPDWIGWLCPFGASVGCILVAWVLGHSLPTADWAPGVPTPSDPKRQAFDDAFWPQLYSGLLAAAVTGVVIGLILLFAEHRFLDRQTLLGHREAFDGLRRSVWAGAGFTDIVPYVPPAATSIVPVGATVVVQASQDKPLSIWRQRLGEERGFFQRLDEMLAEMTRYSIMAQLTDEGLMLGIRDYFAANGWTYDLDQANVMKGYVLTMMLRDDLQLAGDVFGHEVPVNMLENARQYLLDHRRYGTVMQDFLMALTRLQRSMQALEAAAAR